MATEIKMPQVSQTMEEGTIIECKVRVGDEVRNGDIIFEIEAEKAAFEMESPADGFVKHILVKTGQTLPVGEPILILGDKDEEVPRNSANSPKAGCAAPTIDGPQAVAKLASKVKTFLGVKEPAAPSAAVPTLGVAIPLSRLQKITAQRMLKSKQEIPCFYLIVRADVTKLVEFRTKFNQGGAEVAYNDFIIRAVAIGLEKFPIMTGQLAGDKITLANSIDVGLAVAVAEGTVVPIVRNAVKKTVAEISRDSRALIEKTRSGKLSPADLEGGCITVSNLGAFGVDSFIPIVIPGQCSIVGIGRIIDVCVPEGDDFTVRKLMNITLSVDHRITSGAYAAQFLDFVRKLLEELASLT